MKIRLHEYLNKEEPEIAETKNTFIVLIRCNEHKNELFVCKMKAYNKETVKETIQRRLPPGWEVMKKVHKI